MKAVFFTVHDALSSRKVDFHFWAEEFASRNFDVDFVTVGFSPLTLLKKGGRRYPLPYNEWQNISAGFAGNGTVRRYVWCAPFHPMGVGDFLNKLLDPLFGLYPALMPGPLCQEIADADICIVENGAGLLLVPRLKDIMPCARMIYNVCDRIETLGYHPSIPRAEKDALPLFDQIRVPAQVMVEDFAGQGAGHKTSYIPHGLQKAAFDKTVRFPYTTPKNVVSVGDMLFDADTVRALARDFPDWTFHLFGRGARVDGGTANITVHGERPFDEIIPYLVHADIGLAPYRPAASADYLSQSSMKMIQYTYCRLPILAPRFAATGRAHVCAYDPGDIQSLHQAMAQAIAFDRSSIDITTVLGWDETADRLLEGARV